MSTTVSEFFANIATATTQEKIKLNKNFKQSFKERKGGFGVLK